VVAPAPHGVHDALLFALLNVPAAHASQRPAAGAKPAAHTAASPRAAASASSSACDAATMSAHATPLVIAASRAATREEVAASTTDVGRPVTMVTADAMAVLQAVHVAAIPHCARHEWLSPARIAVPTRSSAIAGRAAATAAARTLPAAVPSVAAARAGSPNPAAPMAVPGPQARQHAPGPAAHFAPNPHGTHPLAPGVKLAAHTHACAASAPVARVVDPTPHGVHDVLLLAFLNVPTAHGTKSPEASTVAPGPATQPREDDEATERPLQLWSENTEIHAALGIATPVR
jgi:hypothetical protein